MIRRILSFVCILLLLATQASHAGEVAVAVAANFTTPMKKLAETFEQETGHRVRMTAGSTGKFYAQIRNGAPFDVLLAADAETPEKLEKEGLGVAGTRFTYAVGRLALWSPRAGMVDDRGEVLKKGGFAHLAIANPKLAPYGVAAMDTLRALGVLGEVQDKLVLGENIAQTFQFVASGSAELGFVALSQITEDGQRKPGSAWIVPANLHAPIRQETILLQRGKGNAAAEALLRYLNTEPAKNLIRQSGYSL
ncbi:molybdate ABC transporter substrate-binding protein [Noviherbaspirillum galbum]|uniref:Molybdate ABC transporter substrate-binding protein n=1 Tax=Noviherbaspirillum galbum TaxID=2709383 RepID=A0A6B3SIS8_9BURK|nr:molybdate ABC transporter substrate-binding protein [Noviherbaspirillum galbum]NEX60603.1 molybdate ABC transporter substrate-binding protein [Noviherbaspirillum galbum]